MCAKWSYDSWTGCTWLARFSALASVEHILGHQGHHQVAASFKSSACRSPAKHLTLTRLTESTFAEPSSTHAQWPWSSYHPPICFVASAPWRPFGLSVRCVAVQGWDMPPATGTCRRAQGCWTIDVQYAKICMCICIYIYVNTSVSYSTYIYMYMHVNTAKDFIFTYIYIHWHVLYAIYTSWTCLHNNVFSHI